MIQSGFHPKMNRYSLMLFGLLYIYLKNNHICCMRLLLTSILFTSNCSMAGDEGVNSEISWIWARIKD